MGGPALAAEHLTLTWDGVTTIVEDACLHVDAGEICCLVGRSGCGKTTVLHALAGLERPVSGRVMVGGLDVTGIPGHVGYQLQKDLLLAHLRIIDNVCLPLTLAGMSRDEARAKAMPLLGRFGLAGTEFSWPSQLSGGMRQRAAFLRTYLTGAQVMLLDEPFSALDALTRADLRSWFCDMAGETGIAVVVVTHDVDEALLMGRRVYVLAGAPSSGVASRVAATVDVAGAESAERARHDVMVALG